MYTLTIQDPTPARRPRPCVLKHNSLAAIITEIEIYQTSHMGQNRDMLWFDPCAVSGSTIIHIDQVVFSIECLPFEQDSKLNGVVTKWAEIGDFYSPDTEVKCPDMPVMSASVMSASVLDIMRYCCPLDETTVFSLNFVLREAENNES